MDTGRPDSSQLRGKRRFQFSLRGLLLSVTVVSYFLGVSAWAGTFKMLLFVPPVVGIVWLCHDSLSLAPGGPLSRLVDSFVLVAVLYSLMCLVLH